MRPLTSVVMMPSPSESSVSHAVGRPRDRRYGARTAPRPHFDHREQQRRPALIVDAHRGQLDARRLLVQRMQLDFEPIEAGLARERTTQMFANEIGVVGMNEIRTSDAPTILAPSSGPDERGEAFVGEDDAVAMHGDRFVQSAEQPDQRALALADQQLLDRHLFEQSIGAVRKGLRPAP